MSLHFDPIWSWPVVGVVAVLLFGLVLLTYPQRVRHLPAGRRRMLLGLRLLAALLLVVAAMQPVVRYPSEEDEDPVLVVLADASRSMGTPDGPGGVTRREALLATLAEHDAVFRDLSDDLEIVRYDFGEELKAIVEDEEFTAESEATRTAIGTALEQVADELRGRPVLGVVLLGDGAQRATPPDDADPRDVAERDYAVAGVPIYTVGYGGSGIGENTFDLAIDELLVNPVEFEKKVVPVQARLRALGAAGRELRVRLLVEDRTGKRFGESGEMKPAGASRTTTPTAVIVPDSNDATIPVELSFVPSRTGEIKIGVEVEPVEGELKTANNERQTILTVRRGGVRIAYFDKLRPEMHFLKGVNTDEQIQLDFRLVRFFPNVTQLEAEFFEPGAYDVYMIGDVPAEAFGPENLRRLADRVRDGAGLLMTGGYHNFGPGGYGDTPIERLLPVTIAGRKQPLDAAPDPRFHRQQPLRMVPTRRGLQNYVMRLDTPANNEEHWRNLAPMEGANLLEPRNEAVEVLAETPDGIPLLFLQELRPARVMVFAADTTYRWFLNGFEADHQRFWRQMMLFLARKELEGDQLVWATVEPRNFNPAQRVELEFGARDEEGAAIDGAKFEVEVLGPDGKKSNPTPRRRTDGDVADFLESNEPGDYWVTVRAEVEGERHGTATTRFIVDERDLELDNPAADHGLLREISQSSGGSFVLPEELGSQLKRLLEEGLQAREAINPPIALPLWDRWWFLLLFVAVLSLEWLIRKRRGLV